MQKVFFPVFIILILALEIAAFSEGNGNKKPAGSTIDSTSTSQPTANAVAKEEFTPQLPGYYIGTIAGNLRVQLSISPEIESSVSGHYFYETIGEDIRVNGSCGANMEFVLSETNLQGSTTGYFRGKVESGSRISGTWESADGKKKFPFEMQKVAEYVTFTKTKNKVDFKINYPKFPGSVNGSASLNEAIESAIKDEERSFDAMVKEIGNDSRVDEPMDWFLEVDYSIYGYSTMSISVLISSYSFTGGVHTNSNSDTKNFRFVNGTLETLNLPDLLVPGTDYVSAIGPIIFSDLRKQDAYSITSGTITKITTKEMQKWAIRPSRLIFFYSSYEMGSYTQGEFRVVIPAAKLKKYLNPEGPLQP